MGIRRVAAVTAAAIALPIIGASSAYAWTWASSSNPIVMSGGGGYGNLAFGSTTVTIQSWLRDTKIGDGRVYAKTWINQQNGSLFATLSSGQRSDGESSYARMADKSTTTSSLTGYYDYQVRTCRWVTLVDPCSDDYRTLNN